MFFGFFNSPEIKRLKNGVRAAKKYEKRTRKALRAARIRTFKDTRPIRLVQTLSEDDKASYQLVLSDNERDFQEKAKEHHQAVETLKNEKERLTMALKYIRMH